MDFDRYDDGRLKVEGVMAAQYLLQKRSFDRTYSAPVRAGALAFQSSSFPLREGTRRPIARNSTVRDHSLNDLLSPAA